MNRWAKYLLLGIVIGVVMVPPVQLVSLAQEPTNVPVRPGPSRAASTGPAHLQIGKVAPEIEGDDINGVKFKLSDYRGKVVVLDFWGDW